MSGPPAHRKRWLALHAVALVVVTPFLFYISIQALRSAGVLARTEFENRDLSRAVWQSRTALAFAAPACPFGATPAYTDDALESCLRHVEAAASQFDTGIVDFDPERSLRTAMHRLLDGLEGLAALPEAERSAAAPGLRPAWDEVMRVNDRLGGMEADHWLAAARKHTELGERLDQLTTLHVALLTFFVLLNFALLLLLTRIIQANAKVIEAQRELEERSAQLAHSSKLSSLGEMAGGIAHEINNPLTVINGRVQILRTLASGGPLGPGVVDENCDRIERNVERITTIIRSLRSVARDVAGAPLEPAAPQALLADTLDLCRERFRSHGIDLRVRDEAGGGPAALCRPGEVGQILINVLNNAYDAVMELPESERWVEILAQAAGGAVTFRVTDAGRGIPAHVLARIFEPFFTTKGVSKGTGLGMSISRSLAESQGGRFYVNPASSHTQFVLELRAVG